MASNKNQHFVPRVYLRRFATSESQINLFNIDRKRLICNAAIKHQCSGDYFYGKDEKLEEAIQAIEGGYGSVMRELDINCKSFNSAHKTPLKLFWLFQHLRTESAARRSLEMMENLGLSDVPTEQFTTSIKDAVQMACLTFAKGMHHIDDLKFCLFKNKTSTPFITSDNPAVLTNKWRLDKERDPVFSFGLGSAGMLALLPLRPDLLFIGYDGDVYNVPNKNGFVEIKNARDVAALNRHQFLQCQANIYVDGSRLESDLIQEFALVEGIRPVARHVTHYAVLDEEVGNYQRFKIVSRDDLKDGDDALIHSQVVHPHPGAWPSQITIRSSGSVYTNGTGGGYVRYSGITSNLQKAWVRERP